MKVFIPLTDDMLDTLDCAERLVPYTPGAIPLSAIPAAVKDRALSRQSMSSSSRSPGTTPSSAALPALSSRTYRAGPVLG